MAIHYHSLAGSVSGRRKLAHRSAWRLESHPTASLTGRQAGVMALQQTVGNRAAAQFVQAQRPPAVQRKHILATERTAAQTALTATYPKLEINWFGSETTADEFWETYLKKTGTSDHHTLSGVIDRLLTEQVSPEDKTKPITITFVWSGLDAASGCLNLHFKASKVNKDGMTVQVTVQQVFSGYKDKDDKDKDKLKVKIESVVAVGQGKKTFAKGLLPLYKQLGVTKLSLDASQIAGSSEGMLAWVRYGFIPEQASWDKMRDQGVKLVNSEVPHVRKFLVLTKLAPTALQQRMLDIFKDSSPRAIRRLVLLSWEQGGEVTKTLNAVLGSPWPGTLDLSKEQDRRWIELYTGEEDKTRFKELLPQFQNLA
jgi:hypothetical protein